MTLNLSLPELIMSPGGDTYGDNTTGEYNTTASPPTKGTTSALSPVLSPTSDTEHDGRGPLTH